MSEKIKSAWPHVLFKVCVFAALIITSAYLLVYGLSTTKEYHFGYKETGDIDYTVKLLSGNFLNEESLASDEVYYSDSIDDINTVFQYNADFTDEVSGDYSYYLVATTSAEDEGGEKLWTKSTQITELVTKNIANSKKLRISLNQEIDYPTYNEIMKTFAEEYHDAAVGKLIITLVVKGNFTTTIMDRPAIIDSQISLGMPLAKKAVTIQVATDTDNDGKIYTKRVDVDSDRHRFCRFAGALLTLTVLFLGFCLIRNAYIERRKHIYDYSVNKLREEYDSIIVDLNSKPRITKLHVANVQAFDELLDVYNSIKQPINYYEAKDGAHFILINGRLAWQYIIPKTKSIRKPAPKRQSRPARQRK